MATKDQVSADLSGEAAILNLKSSTYFGLNTVGASIWKLIQEPKKVTEIRDAIVEEYDVEPDRCERDILELLQELSKSGLIEIIDEKNPQISRIDSYLPRIQLPDSYYFIVKAKISLPTV